MFHGRVWNVSGHFFTVNQMAANKHQRDHLRIAFWLLICCGLILAMILLGGFTRLTQSGLSMVDWKPIMGIIPPITDAHWMEAFAKYKQFPEFRWVNTSISLQEFKSIFLVEYAHRVLGRLIGVFFLLPFVYFLITRKLTGQLRLKLLIIFILGGLQGLLGWYMVKSGLVNDPHVSQYRLTAHLGVAVFLYAYILWIALGFLGRAGVSLFAAEKLESFQSDLGIGQVDWLKVALPALVVLVFMMMLSGGFMAGTKAGLTFNTFPTMDGEWVPSELLALTPVWRNFFENIVTIQFTHRCLALIVVAGVVVVWGMVKWWISSRLVVRIAHLLFVALGLQVALGVSTLLYVVPIPLAIAHQGGAMLLLSIAIMLNGAVMTKLNNSG